MLVLVLVLVLVRAAPRRRPPGEWAIHPEGSDRSAIHPARTIKICDVRWPSDPWDYRASMAVVTVPALTVTGVEPDLDDAPLYHWVT